MRNTAKTWYLKKKNDTRYGPVSLEELAIWAQQCRITAGNQASNNQTDWMAVQDIPVLAMDWLALRSDGKQYGPFPISAVPELVKHNVLPADAILTHRETGENMNVQDALHKTPETTPPSHAGPDRTQTAETPAPAPSKSTTPATTGPGANPKAPPHEPHPNPCTDTTAAPRLKQEIQTLQDALEHARQQRHRLQTDEHQHQNTIAELRQQVAFMKKNNAALSAQLRTVRDTADQRARMLVLAWLVVTLSVATSIVMLLGRGSRTTPAHHADTPETQLATDSTTTEALPPITGQSPPTSETRTGSPPTTIQVPGITSTARPDHSQLFTFDEGIFSSLDTLSSQGRQRLDAIARQLPRNLDGGKLIIHGHTDNIPMRNTSRFADNEALALARAEAAAQHLTQRAGFPADAIEARAGTTAPFPNDSTKNRTRNRTVTIERKTRPADQ